MDVQAKARKLLRLARDRGPKSPEGRTAYTQAKRLMSKHGLTNADVYPLEPKAPEPEPREAGPGVDPRFDPVMSGRPPRNKVEDVKDGVTKVVSRLSELFGLGL